jgi:hypothetical protein
MKRLSGRIIPDYPAGCRRIGWQDVSGFPGRIRPDYVNTVSLIERRILQILCSINETSNKN